MKTKILIYLIVLFKKDIKIMYVQRFDHKKVLSIIEYSASPVQRTLVLRESSA